MTKQAIKETFMLYFQPLVWFFRWLFKKSKPKVNRDITTKKFQDFVRYYGLEDVKKGKYPSDEDFKMRYISATGLSPFLGDNDLVEAKKFVFEIENRASLNHSKGV